MAWLGLRVRVQRALERARQVLFLGEFRGGALVGMDQLGNKYYEVTDEARMLPFRNRYVEYASAWWRKDASQIPAEWHGWLHGIVDEAPTRAEYARSRAYTGHAENGTGGAARYVPYPTERPRVWEYNGRK